MARKLIVEIIGDSRSLEKAFARSSNAVTKFNQQVAQNRSNLAREMQQQARSVQNITAAEEQLIKVRSRRASSIGPFKIAGAGLGVATGLFAATQVVRELGDRLEVTGTAAFTTEGKIRNMVSALTSGSLVGAFDALRAAPKTFADLGISTTQARTHMEAFNKVLAGETKQLHSHIPLLHMDREERQRLRDIEKEAGVEGQKQAELVRIQIGLENQRVRSLERLRFSQRKYNEALINGTGAIVAYKGAVDSIKGGAMGVGLRAFEHPWQPERAPAHKPLSPSQRRELDLVGKEGAARLPDLRERLRQQQNMAKLSHTNEVTLKIMTNIKNTEAEIAAITKDIAATRKAAAEAAAEAAKAAREARLATELGWLEFALERADTTKTIKDNLKVLKDTEAYWLRRRQSEGKTLEIMQGLWRTQEQIRKLGKGDADPLAGLMQVSSRKLAGILAAGTGLGDAGRRVLGANIAGTQMQPLYIGVNVDGREIGRATTKDQARTGSRTANQTSGRRG